MNYRGLLLLRFRMDALLKYQGNYGNVEKLYILRNPSSINYLKFFLGSTYQNDYKKRNYPLEVEVTIHHNS